MAFSDAGLADYVDVAQRLADFRQTHPAGYLQPLDPARPWEQVTVTGYDKDGKEITQTFIVYVAAAYREPGDEHPGVGTAWEVFPGRTPYTRGSELMNAETSAWGRAIVACLASDTKRGVASREEVRNRVAERGDGLPVNGDGSLSRSRTTDAEKDSAGVMTAAQQREHTALRRGAAGRLPAGERRPERLSSTPADDPWYDAPAGPAPALAPEDRPGTIDARQRSQIMAAFGKLGREERLARLSELAGREVGSVNGLSRAEAAKVLEAVGT